MTNEAVETLDDRDNPDPDSVERGTFSDYETEWRFASLDAAFAITAEQAEDLIPFELPVERLAARRIREDATRVLNHLNRTAA